MILSSVGPVFGNLYADEDASSHAGRFLDTKNISFWNPI